MSNTHSVASPPKWLLLLAIFGALMGAFADTLLLYVPEPAFMGDSLLYLTRVPSLFWGMVLGVLFIPLEGFGLWWLYRKLQPTQPRRAGWALALGMGFVTVGVSVHVIFGLVGMGYASHPQPYDWTPDLLHFDIMTMLTLGALGGVAFLLHIVLNILLFVATSTRTSPFPRWLRWVNPLLLYVVFVLLYYVVPPLGYITAPSAFNLAYGLFFLVLYLLPTQSTVK